MQSRFSINKVFSSAVRWFGNFWLPDPWLFETDDCPGLLSELLLSEFLLQALLRA
jgi:hypothetical protein